jgi:hypothetical protein
MLVKLQAKTINTEEELKRKSMNCNQDSIHLKIPVMIS